MPLREGAILQARENTRATAIFDTLNAFSPTEPAGMATSCPRPGGPLIAHLKGRETLLRPLGFTPQQAEWITLVCLHSGLFTRDQVEAFLRLTRRTA